MRRKIIKRLFLLCLIIISICFVCKFFFAASVKEELLFDLNKYGIPKYWIPTVRHAQLPALICSSANGKYVLVWKGRKFFEEGYIHPAAISCEKDKISYMVTSQNGAQYDVKFVECNGSDKTEIVVNNFGDADVYSSRDGQTSVFMVSDRQDGGDPVNYRIYRNGKEGGKFGRIEVDRDTAFSFDGRRFAYVASKGNRKRVICDETFGEEYDDIVSSPVFSNDGMHFAYAAIRNGRTYVVRNGNEVECPYDAWEPAFNPVNNELAFIIRRDHKDYVLLNKTESLAYDKVVGKISFSSDGKHVAYIIKDESTKRVRLVVDGKPGMEYSDIDRFTFARTGNHYIYVATLADGTKCVVHDGRESKKYNSILDCLLSPEGDRVAYIADAGEAYSNYTRTVVVDGVDVGVYKVRGSSEEVASCCAFSEDGKHFVFLAKAELNLFQTIVNKVKKVFSEENWNMVLDGRTGQNYAWLTSPFFTPDGKLIYYAIRDRDDLKLLRITVDLK